MIKSSSMIQVEIYRLKKGGAQEVIAVCHLDGNTAICKGSAKFVERMNRDGIIDRSVIPPEKVFPSDGRRFLEALENHFNSGHLTASFVQNGDSNQV